jgi:predicted transcriptional regulator
MYDISSLTEKQLNSNEISRLEHTLLYILEEQVDKLHPRRLRASFWNVLCSEPMKITCIYEFAACLQELCYFKYSALIVNLCADYIAKHKKQDPELFFRNIVTELTQYYYEEQQVLSQVTESNQNLVNDMLVFKTYYPKLSDNLMVLFSTGEKNTGE